MSRFGVFHLAEEVGHFVFGTTELHDLPAGRYEAASLEEDEALRHLAAVSRQGPDDEISHTMAELVEEPDEFAPPAAPAGTPAPNTGPPLPQFPPAPTAPPASVSTPPPAPAPEAESADDSAGITAPPAGS